MRLLDGRKLSSKVFLETLLLFSLCIKIIEWKTNSVTAKVFINV